MKKVTPTNMNAALSIGLEFVGILAVTSFLGYLADTYWLETKPGLFFIIGVIVGFAYGLYFLVKKMKSLEESFKKEAYSAPKKNVSEQAKKIEHDIENLGERIDKFVESEKQAKKKG